MKIRELLKTPEKWTRGTFAKGIRGDSVHFASKHAVCWCLMGAVYQCYPTNIIETTEKLATALKCPFQELAAWNDAHSHAEVLALVEKLDL